MELVGGMLGVFVTFFKWTSQLQLSCMGAHTCALHIDLRQLCVRLSAAACTMRSTCCLGSKRSLIHASILQVSKS